MKNWLPEKYRHEEPTLRDWLGGIAFGIGLLIFLWAGLGL